MALNYIQNLLVSGRPLAITHDGYRQLMLSEFPTVDVNSHNSACHLAGRNPEALQLYQATKILQQTLSQHFLPMNDECSRLTTEYENASIAAGAVAYHPVIGFITADCSYYFSSKALEVNLLAAENNPKIGCHLLHINTPGGEAWYLDRLSETMRSLNKPAIAYVEGSCCSAGYYIACHAQHIYAATLNDYIGCIGTMVSFYDFEPYFAQLGIRKVEARAEQSDLKNQEFEQLRQGKDKVFVKEFLNPMNDLFINEVTSQRAALAHLEKNTPVLRGKTYTTIPAIEEGLIDEQRKLFQVLDECYLLADNYLSDRDLLEKSYSVLT